MIQVLARKQSSKQQKPVNTQEVKLIGGLLTGVNRAFPYAKGDISFHFCVFIFFLSFSKLHVILIEEK